MLKGLADQDRTVYLSSHLTSEMALTADHVIVVGKVGYGGASPTTAGGDAERAGGRPNGTGHRRQVTRCAVIRLRGRLGSTLPRSGVVTGLCCPPGARPA